MKATGIVRRIDDLGRVVVPKEIRRTLRIKESDPLEIFTDRDGKIILKKYSPIGELGDFAKEYAQSLAQVSGYTVCIADHDQINAASGKRAKEYAGRLIDEELETVILNRKTVKLAKKEAVRLTQNDAGGYQSQVISVITSLGDCVGAVIIFSENGETELGETEIKLAKAAAGFLGRQMEQQNFVCEIKKMDMTKRKNCHVHSSFHDFIFYSFLIAA